MHRRLQPVQPPHEVGDFGGGALLRGKQLVALRRQFLHQRVLDHLRQLRREFGLDDVLLVRRAPAASHFAAASAIVATRRKTAASETTETTASAATSHSLRVRMSCAWLPACAAASRSRWICTCCCCTCSRAAAICRSQLVGHHFFIQRLQRRLGFRINRRAALDDDLSGVIVVHHHQLADIAVARLPREIGVERAIRLEKDRQRARQDLFILGEIRGETAFADARSASCCFA